MPEAGLLISWLGHMFDTKNEILLFADKDRREELATRVARAGYTIAAFNDFSVEEWEAQGGAVTRPLFSTIDTMKKTPNAYILDSRNQEEALKERVEGSHNIPYFLIDKNVSYGSRRSPRSKRADRSSCTVGLACGLELLQVCWPAMASNALSYQSSSKSSRRREYPSSRTSHSDGSRRMHRHTYIIKIRNGPIGCGNSP